LILKKLLILLNQTKSKKDEYKEIYSHGDSRKNRSEPRNYFASD
jgi:hypothetical protein